MTKLQKFILILGYIFTFGILFFILKKMAKKQAQVVNDSLIVSNNIPFNIDDFILSLGGLKNIAFCSSTISSIKIKLFDKSLFDEIKFKKFKPKGYMWDAENTLTILFGDFSSALEKFIKNKLTNYENISQQQKS
ncbi:hypothetical protein [Mycoplasmoides alvi]|uniref:hypothetical protein n=1 Tax=Mycoplasmoides alvi TaxID=78580 RepID=UPI00051BE50A|nr:hypothetical protein [Mycoplasmoides alvi]